MSISGTSAPIYRTWVSNSGTPAANYRTWVWVHTHTFRIRVSISGIPAPPYRTWVSTSGNLLLHTGPGCLPQKHLLLHSGHGCLPQVHLLPSTGPGCLRISGTTTPTYRTRVFTAGTAARCTLHSICRKMCRVTFNFNNDLS